MDRESILYVLHRCACGMMGPLTGAARIARFCEASSDVIGNAVAGVLSKQLTPDNALHDLAVSHADEQDRQPIEPSWDEFMARLAGDE